MTRGVWAAVNIRVIEQIFPSSVMARKKRLVSHLREEQAGNLTSLEFDG